MNGKKWSEDRSRETEDDTIVISKIDSAPRTPVLIMTCKF